MVLVEGEALTLWQPVVSSDCPPRAGECCGIRAVSSRPAPAEESILDEAERLVNGARRDGYGHPLDNHTCTARMFAAYLERKYAIAIPIDADDVCWFNTFQKASRDANQPARDNLVDGAGYLRNIEILREERDRRV